MGLPMSEREGASDGPRARDPEFAHVVSTRRAHRWLDTLIQEDGSDLFLVADRPPSIRVGAEIRPLDGDPLSGSDIEDALQPVLTKHAADVYRQQGYVDVSLRHTGGRRFRLNLHHERGRPAATIRALPSEPPRIEELRLPRAVEALTRLPYGLVLIGGPAGSGKTTTLASCVDAINRRDRKHIVTIEDPIEYEHPHRGCVIEQVEIGIDAPDFPTALRSAVRQSPDVIVIGEMRDPETMRIALAASETGHLVFSTLHASDVTATVSRLADSFPSERQATIRQELAMALAAVMTQRLVPSIDGGQVPAVELLMVGYGARQHIRKNALQHLHQEITITRKAGSCTFEESLAELVRSGLIKARDARGMTTHANELESLLGFVSMSAPRTS